MQGRTPRRGLVWVCACLLFSHQQGAASLPADAALCDLAASAAAEGSGVPLEILQAIARVETGRGSDRTPWPWAINQGGEGLWFDDAGAAVAHAADQVALGDSNFDVGCFQINLHWHPDAFANLDDAFDPLQNARYAATFLQELLASEGSWSAAVAAYHSRDDAEAAKYLTAVEAALAALRAGDAPVAVGAGDARENRFPLLRAGSHGRGASLVPALAAGQPLFAAAP